MLLLLPPGIYSAGFHVNSLIISFILGTIFCDQERWTLKYADFFTFCSKINWRGIRTHAGLVSTRRGCDFRPPPKPTTPQGLMTDSVQIWVWWCNQQHIQVARHHMLDDKFDKVFLTSFICSPWSDKISVKIWRHHNR